MRESRAQLGSRDRGSVLLLAPAGLLAVVVLAAIATDLAHVHMVRGELQLVAAAAANDAVSAGLDETALRSGLGISLDPARVREVVHASLAASAAPDLASPPEIGIRTTGPSAMPSVTVELAVVVRPVFASALPVGADPMTVRAVAEASARER